MQDRGVPPALRRCRLGALALVAAGLAVAPTASGATTTPAAATPGAPATALPSWPRRSTPSPPPAPPVTERASGVAIPWSVLPLPDGSLLVDERDSGRVLRVPADGGAPEPLTTIPGVATDTASGGLLGLARSPGYRRDHLVYAYVTSATDDRVVRFSTADPAHAVTPVLTGIPKERQHNGGAIAFGPDGTLYVGTGDGGIPARAQDPASLDGKILRVRPDGTVPLGNPYGTAVWSIGHRNVEGLAFDRRGRLWESELGESAFDEVNRIVRGGNGGWPIREGHVAGPDPSVPAGPGALREPDVVWTTKEASPSGATVVGNTLYVAGLRGEGLWRIPIGCRGLGTPTKWFEGVYGRLRAVAPAPGGDLWMGTTNLDHPDGARPGDDRLLRVATGRR